jgi:hypothetical protein
MGERLQEQVFTGEIVAENALGPLSKFCVHVGALQLLKTCCTTAANRIVPVPTVKRKLTESGGIVKKFDEILNDE